MNLHVVDRPGTDPALPPVVFVHGLQDSWHSFEKQYEKLGSSRRVIALDSRGHGDSDKPQNASYSVQMFAQDLRTVLDALNVERIGLLVGHSLGSWISWHFAGTWPASVERLLLIGTSADFPDLDSPAVKHFLKDVKRMGSKPFTYDMIYDMLKEPTEGCGHVSSCGQWFFDTCIYEEMRMPPFVVPLFFNNNEGTFRAAAQQLLPKITAATAILRGENDPIQTQTSNERMLALLQQGEACRPSLKVVEGQGHSLHWTYQGASVVATVMQELLESPSHFHGTVGSALRGVPTNSPSPVAALTLVLALALATATSIHLIATIRSRRSTLLGEMLLDGA